MAKATITLIKRPATEAEIAAFERKIDGRLPADYREFLKRYNGGRPTPSHHPEGDVTGFMSLDDDSKGPKLAQFFEILEHRIPSDTIAIALDSLGNPLCMRVRGTKAGEIWFWEAEKEESPRESADEYYNMTRIAGSFAEFFDMLDEYSRYFDEEPA